MTDGRRVARHANLTGQVFSRWTVLGSVPKSYEKYHGHALYFCRCACGTEGIVAGIHLRGGRSKSCDCLRVDVLSKRPFESLHNRLLYTASKRGQEVALTYEEYLAFTEQKSCHYCDAEIVWGKLRTSTGHNLDRKDNALGYSVENCVVCCGSCNRTKGDRYTYEEFMLIAPILKMIQEMRKAKT
jgi:hypothetical protein